VRQAFKTGLALLLVLAASGSLAAAAGAESTRTPDGSTLAFWDNLNVRLIGADGVPKPGIHDLTPGPPPPNREYRGSDRAMAADGTSTFVWIEIEGIHALLRERRASAEGSPLGEIHTIAEGVEEHVQLAIDVAPDGTATVVWNDNVTSEVFARQIAPDGTPAATTKVLNPSSPRGRSPDVAVAPDGTATIVWVERVGEGNELRSRQIAPDGTLGEPHTLGSSDWGMEDPEIGVADDGTATVIWTQWELGGEEEEMERQISPAGVPQGEVNLVSAAGEKAWFPSLFVAPDGTGLITWNTGKHVLVARRLDGSGNLSPTTIPLYAGAYSSLVKVGVSSDGVYTIAWATEGCGRSCVFERRLLPDDTLTPLNGVFKSAGILAVGRVSVGDDGSAVLVVGGRLGTARVLETRKVEADGTLSPYFYDVTALEPEPTIAPPFSDSDPAGTGAGGEEGATAPAVTAGSTPPSSPDKLVLAVGKAHLNKQSGTAALPVRVSSPGTATVAGQCAGGVAAGQPVPVDPGTNLLRIAAKGQCRRQLLRTGATSFGVTVTVTPTKGATSSLHARISLLLYR
jgi:hypothetical protein